MVLSRQDLDNLPARGFEGTQLRCHLLIARGVKRRAVVELADTVVVVEVVDQQCAGVGNVSVRGTSRSHEMQISYTVCPRAASSADRQSELARLNGSSLRDWMRAQTTGYGTG